MYMCGDFVVYGMHGVCKVDAVERRCVNGKSLSFYVLVPINQVSTKFYVPQHNEAAMAKLRPLLSKELLESLLHSEEVRQDAWISDDNRRKQSYKELISSGNCTALLRMVHTLHRQKKIQAELGRKFHLCDENFLRDAERLLISEFAIVLEMPMESVLDYIKTCIGINETVL